MDMRPPSFSAWLMDSWPRLFTRSNSFGGSHSTPVSHEALSNRAYALTAKITPLSSHGVRQHVQGKVTRDSHTSCFFISQKFQQRRSSSVFCQYVEMMVPGVVVPIIHATPRVTITDITPNTTGQFAHLSESRAEIFSVTSTLHSTGTTSRFDHSQTAAQHDPEIKVPHSFPGTPPR